MKKRVFTALFFLQFLSALWSASPHPVFGEKGMVVSTSKQASQAGIEILKKGGNAIDAAVAVGFALAVTSSGNGNLGGGGFWLLHFQMGYPLPLITERKPHLNQKEICF